MPCRSTGISATQSAAKIPKPNIHPPLTHDMMYVLATLASSTTSLGGMHSIAYAYAYVYYARSMYSMYVSIYSTTLVRVVSILASSSIRDYYA